MTDQKFPESSCSCPKCVKMCEGRPCWGTPAEIQKIIDAGHGNRLMLDWWENASADEIRIVAPAIVGYEGKKAPYWPMGRCAFLNEKSLCDLHDLGLKPLEGRAASCKDQAEDGCHEHCAKSFDTKEGRKVVRNFQEISK